MGKRTNPFRKFYPLVLRFLKLRPSGPAWFEEEAVWFRYYFAKWGRNGSLGVWYHRALVFGDGKQFARVTVKDGRWALWTLVPATINGTFGYVETLVAQSIGLGSDLPTEIPVGTKATFRIDPYWIGRVHAKCWSSSHPAYATPRDARE